MDTAIREYYINSYIPGIKYLKDSDLDTVRNFVGTNASFRFLAEKAQRYISWSNATPSVATVGTVAYGEDTATSITSIMNAGTLNFVLALVSSMESMVAKLSGKITYTFLSSDVITADKAIYGTNYATIRSKYLTEFANLTNAITTATAANKTSLGAVIGRLKTLSINAVPSVATGLVKSIVGKKLQVSGSILNDGSTTVSERGFVWGTQENPTLTTGTKQAINVSTADFTYTIIGATADSVGTVYFVRAYATNAQGTGYGSQVRGILADTPGAPVLGTVGFAKPANMTPTVFVDPDENTTPLYDFTTFTFTNLGATGKSGPTSLSGYASIPGSGTTSALTLSNGIQIWTVPKTGIYTIEAWGAKGGAEYNSASAQGTTGAGAKIKGQFILNIGDKIRILVGQMGIPTPSATLTSNPSGSGGGGTFVVLDSGASNPITSTNMLDYVLVVAGGGGGKGYTSNGQLMFASIVASGSGNNSGSILGGSGGDRGQTGYSSSNSSAGAGLIDVSTSTYVGSTQAAQVILAKSFVSSTNPGMGGYYSNVTSGVLYYEGGFGGGGHGSYETTTSIYWHGGGGGGFSGGAARYQYAGGGGGSYINDTSPDKTKTYATNVSRLTGGTDGNFDHGRVIITWIGQNNVSSINPTFSISATLPTATDLVSAGFIWGQTSIVPNAAGLTETLRNRTVQYITYGSKTVQLSGISVKSNTQYRMRGFIKNKVNISYSSEQLFTTPSILTVLTNNVDQPDKTSLVVNVSISVSGTGATETGFLYSTTVQTPAFNTDGSLPSGVGSYASLSGDLISDGTYNIRGYAINAFGVFYGTVISYTIKKWLFNFTSNKFTSCLASGINGPTLAQCKTSYSGTSWISNYFTVDSGIQVWTVPVDGIYSIQALGTSGGKITAWGTVYNAGSVATITGSFRLNKNDTIAILVGQPSNYAASTLSVSSRGVSSGGGGASYVAKYPYSTISDVYIIAAGSAGAYTNSGNPYGGKVGTNVSTAVQTLSNTEPTTSTLIERGGGFSLDGSSGAKSFKNKGAGYGNGGFGGGGIIGGGGFTSGGFSLSDTARDTAPTASTSFYNNKLLIGSITSSTLSSNVDGSVSITFISY